MSNVRQKTICGPPEKPDVISVNGLRPFVSSIKNPSAPIPVSTVGTMTDISDYRRMLSRRWERRIADVR